MPRSQGWPPPAGKITESEKTTWVCDPERASATTGDVKDRNEESCWQIKVPQRVGRGVRVRACETSEEWVFAAAREAI